MKIKNYNWLSSRLIMVVLLTLILTPSAHAAAPWIMMIHGESLQRPIFLTDWHQNQRVMVSVKDASSITVQKLANRPYFKVTFFWGPEWQNYIKNGNKVESLKPEQGNQQGRFYPEYGGAPAVFAFESIPGNWPLRRQMHAEGMEIFKKAGVPTHITSR